MRLRSPGLAILLGACAVAPPASAPGPLTELGGRVAGVPQRCISLNPADALRTAENDRHVLFYGSGRTIWVNRLGPACGFGRDDILVIEPMGSSLCRGDLVRSVDRYSRIPGPACVLGDFVAFSRPR